MKSYLQCSELKCIDLPAGRTQPFPKQQPQPLKRLKTEDSSNAGPALTAGTAGATNKEAPLVFQPGAETWVNI